MFTNGNHHTSKNLATEIAKIVKEWEIPAEKIILLTSDNAANITSAIKNELGWKHFGCFAHTLNLVIQKTVELPELIVIIDKIKSIVGYFRRSNISNEKLMKCQQQMGQQPLKLIQEVKTRWNSLFYMLERFILLEDAIKSTTAIIDHQFPLLTPTEWAIIKDLCKVLKPFEKLTKLISGENYATASYVIPITNGLFEVCRNLKKKDNHSKIIIDVLKILETQLHQRLENVEYSTTLSLAAFLDPRFKMIAFSNAQAAENTKKKVTDYITYLISEENRVLNEPENNLNPGDHEDLDDELSVWGAFEKAVTSAQPIGTSKSRAIIEVQRYLEANILPRKEDPFKWWRENKYNFPYISKIAQEKLCVQASSVPCERLFSKAGLIIWDRRNRLKALKVQQLLFLNVNSSL